VDGKDRLTLEVGVPGERKVESTVVEASVEEDFGFFFIGEEAEERDWEGEGGGGSPTLVSG
jgi:hypothetical protein